MSETTNSKDTMSADRLTAFRDDVAKLKVGGTNTATVERVFAVVGLLAAAVGVLIAVVAYTGAKSAGDYATVYRDQVLGGVGIVVAIVGTLVWLRISIIRHLRWWMIRMVYEQREQTDRLIAALREQR